MCRALFFQIKKKGERERSQQFGGKEKEKIERG